MMKAISKPLSATRYVLTAVLLLIASASGSPLHAQDLIIRDGGRLTMDSGAKVTVAGGVTLDSFRVNRPILDDPDIVVGGDWTNNGGLITGTGTVEFNGTAPQTILGSQGTTFSQLTVNNPNGVALKQNVVVDKGLTFLAGKILADSGNITLSSQSTAVIGAGSDKYITAVLDHGLQDQKFGNTMRIFLPNTDDTGEVLFPVGGADYAPLSMCCFTHSMPKDSFIIACRVGNASDSIPPGIDLYHYSHVDWRVSEIQSAGSLLSYQATFDLTSTNNTGDMSKYIVMKTDADSGWMRPTVMLLPRPPKYAINGGTTLGRFVLGEPAGSGSVKDAIGSLLDGAVIIDRVVPNPGSSTISLNYSLGENGVVRLELFNVLGQSVAVLSDGYRTLGKHQESFNVASLQDGSYYLRLTTRSGRATARVTVVH